MNGEAIGAISQIVGAVLVGITLIYLAVQLRQNTSALKSSTFLAISGLMGSTMEVWAYTTRRLHAAREHERSGIQRRAFERPPV